MNVDENARARLNQLQSGKIVADKIDRLTEVIKQAPVFNKVEPARTPASELAQELRALQKSIGGGNLTDSIGQLVKALDSFEVDSKAIGALKTLVAELTAKLRVMSEISANIPKEVKMNFPKKFPVEGTIGVDSLPPVRVANLQEISNSVNAALGRLQEITANAIRATKVEIPTSTKIDSPVQIVGMPDMLEALEELKKGFNLLLAKEGFGGGTDSTMKVEIVKDLPRLVPQPVTNMNINPLRGLAKGTAITVATTPVALPTTPLANRRTLILYNNSSNTVYLGGSDVNTSNGLPIVATSFSPAIDAGPNMIVYAIADTSSDIRVFEVSNDAIGG